MALLGLTLSGCATKRDLKDLQDEIRTLATQQRDALGQIEGLNLATQDTLRGQSDALYESRGETLRRLREIEQQLITLQELMGQNLRALSTLRDLMENRRGQPLPPVRTDTDPGQVMDEDFQSSTPTSGSEAAVETYNVAVRAFNRGSVTTARRAFQQFLTEHPNDPLAPDAHYYLADLLVQEDRLDEAIVAFLWVPEHFPVAEKAADCVYRVGVLYIELEELEDARRYLERAINTYPDSDAAGLARERLAEIS